jgi:hypothetical protein
MQPVVSQSSPFCRDSAVGDPINAQSRRTSHESIHGSRSGQPAKAILVRLSGRAP